MDTSITVTTVIPARVEDVWKEVENLASHTEWMADAERIDFLSDQTAGVGTRMKVATKVGPIRLDDVMEFTAWEPPHRMEVRHEGLVNGRGEFLLERFGDQTRFTWQEELHFPWYFAGALGAFAARPVLAAIWRRNLANLRERFSDPRPPQEPPLSDR